MASQVRKSGRKRKASTKYSVDAFEGLEILDDLDHGTKDTPLPAELDDDGEDDDFEIDAHQSPELAEDDISINNNAAVDELDELDDADDDSVQDAIEDAEILVAGSEVEDTATKPYKRLKYGSTLLKANRNPNDPRFHPRGLLEPATKGAKKLKRLFSYGPAPADMNPAMQAHFKWNNEPTIPSRKASTAGLGGFKRSYYHTEDMVKREADEGWEWYELDGGKEAFQACQKHLGLTPDQGKLYMPEASQPSQKFVMGPYKEQKLFELLLGSSMNLNQAWVQDQSSMDPARLPEEPKHQRHGWMLNLGERIQCMEWVPNQTGSRQFLAVSTQTVFRSTGDGTPFGARSAPAFTPQPPLKSSIQIWEVQADGAGLMDLQHPPKLRHVICTEWGDVKSFKWCPVPRKFDSQNPQSQINLGLLAGLWGDGVVRVLDISIIASSDVDVQYTLMKTAAFSTCPPNTVCTCFTWLSSTGIAVGSANGSVGVWNLPSSLSQHTAFKADAADSSSRKPNFNAEPTFFMIVSTTYLLDITSCYPSRPNILLTTSMAGHLYMTDLLEPPSSASSSPSATIRSTRTRIGRSILHWHDYTQMAISSDDNFTLVAFPLRRFFRQTGFTRYKSPAMAIAVSPVHPFVMAGCVGGEVVSTNPLRRAYNTKVPIYNQTWFTHEWRRLKAGEVRNGIRRSDDDVSAVARNEETATDKDPAGGVDEFDTSVTAPGLSRILEGFRCEQVKLFYSEEGFSHRENGAIYSTVYELNTSVTSVCWNPNLHVGGWIAAGMGSGLIRIEDVAS